MKFPVTQKMLMDWAGPRVYHDGKTLFEAGAVVVQDGRNVLPGETQNFKYLPWSAVAATLGLRSR